MYLTQKGQPMNQNHPPLIAVEDPHLSTHAIQEDALAEYARATVRTGTLPELYLAIYRPQTNHLYTTQLQMQGLRVTTFLVPTCL